MVKGLVLTFWAPGTDQKSASEARALIVKNWRQFFDEKSDLPGYEILFPAPESLRLDFSSMRVPGNRSVTVSPGTWVHVYLSCIFSFSTARCQEG